MLLFFNAAAVSEHFPYPFVKCSQFISVVLLFVLGATLHSHAAMCVLPWLLLFSVLAKQTPALHVGVPGANLFVPSTLVQVWLGLVWGAHFWGGFCKKDNCLFFFFSEKRLMSGLTARCGVGSSKTLQVVAKLHSHD